jgi:hypothetical protein
MNATLFKKKGECYTFSFKKKGECYTFLKKEDGIKSLYTYSKSEPFVI